MRSCERWREWSGRRRRCWSGRPPATRAGGKHRPGRSSSDDVVWAGDCRRGDVAADSVSNPTCCWSPGRLLGLWLVSPLVAWWLSRTLAAAASPPVRVAAGFSAKALPADLAVLRGLCHRGRELAPAGQFPGETGRRASHRAPARPTSAWRSWRTWPPTTSAIAAPVDCSTARRRRSARWPGWSATAAISTTGTTRVRSSRFSRSMSRRWTAATWSATCWCSAAVCWSWSRRSCCGRASLAGLRDTVRVLLDVARGLHRTEEEGRTPLVPVDVLAQDRATGKRPGESTRHAQRCGDVLATARDRGGGDHGRRGRGRGAAVVGQRLRAFVHRPSRRTLLHARPG